MLKNVKKDPKSKIASVYALALYEAAEDKKAVARVSEDMASLLAVIREDRDILKYLANPVWDNGGKKEALKEISKKLKLSPETLSCLDIIADNGRFGELELILEEFRHLNYRKNGIIEVEVQSVKALSSAQDKKLKSSLEKMLSGKIVVNYEIRPELLGGLVVKFNSNMIDDSLKGKLNRLELIMKGGQ